MVRPRPHLSDRTVHEALIDRPIANGAVAAVLMAGFVGVRLATVAHGKIARFVMAERSFVNPAQAPAGLPVLARNGYDGQFYYRLALDPADLARTAFGITLDAPFRLERIGYPALVWLVAVGHWGWIPTSLVLVNVAAVATLAYLGGIIARDAGRRAVWGLLVAGYFGFVFSVARDTAEPVAAAFLVAGLVAYRRRSPVLSGLLLAAGALSRETVMIAVAALVLARAMDLLQRRSRLGPLDCAWGIPTVAFVGWQIVARTASGTFPLLSAGGDNLSLPFRGFLDGIDVHARALLHSPLSSATLPDAAWFVEVVVLCVATVAAFAALSRSAAPLHERIAFVLFVLDLCVLSPGIWEGVVDLRSLDEVWVMAVIVILGLPRGRRSALKTVAAGAVVGLVVVTVHRLVSL